MLLAVHVPISNPQYMYQTICLCHLYHFCNQLTTLLVDHQVMCNFLLDTFLKPIFNSPSDTKPSRTLIGGGHTKIVAPRALLPSEDEEYVESVWLFHAASSQLEVHRSTHPLDRSITTEDISHIQQFFYTTCMASTYDSVLCMEKVIGPPFHDLLTYGLPITDGIIHTFLQLMRHLTGIHVTDTFFAQDLRTFKWNFAYEHYFTQVTHIRWRSTVSTKPSITHPTILIPLHVNGLHWVAVVRWVIDNQVYFLYADDLDSQTTYESTRQLLLTQNTSEEFHPIDTKWINCRAFSYVPHSNESGPHTYIPTQHRMF